MVSSKANDEVSTQGLVEKDAFFLVLDFAFSSGVQFKKNSNMTSHDFFVCRHQQLL